MTISKSMDATVEVEDLRIVGVPSLAAIVEEISFDISPGEILGVVGESGSGKTTLGLALLNYCKEGTQVADGRVTVGDQELAQLSWRAVRRLRGRTVAYIPQSPASALNPALRIGTQLRECLEGEGNAVILDRVREVLREVALPDDNAFLGRYPHQLSGGQQQRVAIAMAFMARPALIVLDEPTTGLDVSTQEHVLATVRRLCHDYRCAAIYISHDMAVVADLADRIAVMYSGRIVEIGTTEDVLNNSRHPYTSRLLLAVPDLEASRPMIGIPGHAPSPLARPVGCAFAPRCPMADEACSASPPSAVSVGERHEVRCIKAHETLPAVSLPVLSHPRPAPETPSVIEVRSLAAGYGAKSVLEDINLAVSPGECLALLGESGSGKTTLSRCIAGLHAQSAGEVRLDGESLAASSFRRSPEQRRRVQYIFQNPYESLNPRRTVAELILQPVKAVRGRVNDPEQVVLQALAHASLRPDHAHRYPEQLSGGERQRVAIARALATEPDVLVCDEITSALDVSVQSSLVDLLRRLQAEMGLTMLFITHNIALVRNVADRVAVLEHGRIVEYGDVGDVFADPQHAYTRALMHATPNFRLPDGLFTQEVR